MLSVVQVIVLWFVSWIGGPRWPTAVGALVTVLLVSTEPLTGVLIA